MENNTLSLTAREVSSASQTFRTTINPEYLQISSDASWCNVWLDNNKSGNFYYSVTANTTGKERKATITIKPNEGNLSVKMNITQLKAAIYISKEKLWFDRNTGNQTITITDDLDNWEVESSSASWCTYTKGDNKLTIRVNATNVDREAVIKFKGYSKILNVVQSKYAVGDNYKEGGKEGIVCYMQDDVRKIYKYVGEAMWSTENVLTGANSYDDGQYNTNIIKQIPNWKDLYPAFALCDELNKNGITGWYLPAINENPEYLQWSSTESSASEAVMIQTNGHGYYQWPNNQKSGKHSVRAFNTF